MSLYWFLILTSTCSLYLYLFLSILFFNDYLEQKRHASFYFSISLILHSSLVFVSRVYAFEAYVTFLLTLALMYFTMISIFKVRHTIAYYGAIRFTFYMFTIRALIISMYSFVTSTSIINVWANPVQYIFLFQVSLIATVLFLYLKIKTFMSKERMQTLFRNQEQLNFVLFIKTILGMFLMIFTYGAHYDVNMYWFTLVQFLTSIMVILIAVYALWNALKVSTLIEYETRTKILETQLETQVNHYKSYQKYTDTFREFRHDYNKALSVVNSLLRSNENEEAIRILDEMGVQMAEGVAAHKEYSNNILLDALLQDFANKISDNEIKFNCMVYWVDTIKIDELAVVRLFTNILTNCQEAVMVLPKSERYITVESRLRKHWLNIQIKNPYTGKVRPNLESTKSSVDVTRGLGVGISRSIVEEMGGVFQWDATDNVFTININLPLVGLKHKDFQ